MKTIEYTVQYTGATGRPRSTMKHYGEVGDTEIIRVQAININAGYARALKKALEPLGNGQAREIGAIEFSQIV